MFFMGVKQNRYSSITEVIFKLLCDKSFKAAAEAFTGD